MTEWGPQLWASLPMPAVLVDPSDLILDVNPAGEQFFNLSKRAMQGVPLFDQLAIDAPLERAFNRMRKNNAPLFVNGVDVSAGQNRPRVCNIQMAPITDLMGHILVMIEPLGATEWLGHGFNHQSRARSAIGMAEMLAHEIKNPLAGIAGAAQLLSMTLPSADLELTDLIVAETRRIVGLLEEVEQFGDRRPPKRQIVNLHDVLERARKSALVGIAGHMRIIERYDPSLPSTFADPDQILQVIANLIRNAVEAAAPRGGVIMLRTFYDPSLRLRRDDGSAQNLPLQIEVIDDGPGIAPEIARDIFEPFVSGRENGTGLGLALVNKIIMDHGGWIGVESNPGETVFRISLPVAPAEHGSS